MMIVGRRVLRLMPGYRCMSSNRWDSSGRWEQETDGVVSDSNNFMLKESFGEYFRVPNPSSLMTKIICTIGPANSSKQRLSEMMDAGMSAARLNASHGEYEFFEHVVKTIRELAEEKRRICPLILDTKGPEIRVGMVENGSVLVNHGQPFTFFKDSSRVGTGEGIGTTYEKLSTTVKIGDVVLVDNGRLSFRVCEINTSSGDVHCATIVGGVIKNRKGVNIPGCKVDLPHITDKDRRDIDFAVKHKFEFIAHSFTRSAAGIMAVREIPGVVENGIHVIAKIENQESLENLASILKVSDGIMVARGDLGVEIPLERVCSVQKRLIKDCNIIGKFVITATEMLDSMVSNPRPTRAEASDVANAVFDGTDCVMLSGETAVGEYPVATIQVMNRICKEAELDIELHKRNLGLPDGPKNRKLLSEAFSIAACATAKDTGASLIIAITKTGETARSLSKHFPNVPILALALSPKVGAQVSLYRGVIPYLVQTLDRQSCVPLGIAKATELGLISTGSRVILVTGYDDSVANRLESFVVGDSIPALSIIPGQKYEPGSSFRAP